MIDLDAAKAARREAKKRGPQVKFGGKKFFLPVELPYSVLEQIGVMGHEDKAAEALPRLVQALLGDHYSYWLDQKPSVEDTNLFIEGVLSEYGLGGSDKAETNGASKAPLANSKPTSRATAKP